MYVLTYVPINGEEKVEGIFELHTTMVYMRTQRSISMAMNTQRSISMAKSTQRLITMATNT